MNILMWCAFVSLIRSDNKLLLWRGKSKHTVVLSFVYLLTLCMFFRDLKPKSSAQNYIKRLHQGRMFAFFV